MVRPEELIECLKRYDEQHSEKYKEFQPRLVSAIFKLGNIHNYICTEDKTFAGDEPRADLYIETERGRFIIEAKLCITSGASIAKGLLPKAKNVAMRLGIPHAPLVILTPKEKTDEAYAQLTRYLRYVMREHGLHIPTHAFTLQYRIDIHAITVHVRGLQPDLLSILRNKYQISALLILPV